MRPAERTLEVTATPPRFDGLSVLVDIDGFTIPRQSLSSLDLLQVLSKGGRTVTDEAPNFGSFVHIDPPATDLARAKRFYGQVFGWKFQDMPDMNYTLFEAPMGPGGGFRTPMKRRSRRPPEPHPRGVR